MSPRTANYTIHTHNTQTIIYMYTKAIHKHAINVYRLFDKRETCVAYCV